MHPLDAPALLAHKEEIASFLQAYNTGRLHHAWMFTGSRGIGKATLINKLAALLLSNPKEASNIEIDNPVLKSKIKNGSHPDILSLNSENEDGEIELITVERVRRINEFLRLTSVESKFRVVVIDAIDEMNSNAANAFLKILEEPPSNVIFLIVCHSIGKIIPTIRSRCRIVKMKNLNFEDFALILRANGVIAQFEIEELYDISGGSLTEALMLSSPSNMSMYQKVKELLGNKSRTQADILALSKLASDKNNWVVIKYALQKELYEVVRNSVSNTENVLNHVEKLQKFLADSENFHLDKMQVVTSVFI